MRPIWKAHVILLLAASAVSAQTISSTIKGSVQDSSGAIQLSLRLTF